MSDKNSNPVGLGGRGNLLLKALQSSTRQPGSSSKTPSCSDKSEESYSSGYVSQFVESSPKPLSEASASSKSIGGRGVRLAKHILQQRSKEDASSYEQIPKGRGALHKLSQSISKSPSSASSESKSLCREMSQISIESEESDLPTIRQGTSGAKFQAVTNWIRLSLEPEKAVFEYSVHFKPCVDSKHLRIQLLNSQRDKIGSVKSFDGSKLWLPIMLNTKVTELSAESKHSAETFKITITFIKKTSMAQSIQLYNVLFNRIMKVLKLIMIGRNYFSPVDAVLVPQHQLEIWPGYVTSVQHMEGGIMLCVDVSHRVLRSNTVYQVMGEIAKYHKANFKDEALRTLVGSIVLTRYNNKSYRVDDIVYDSNPQSTFQSSRGEEISYVDYYKNAYNIQINDINQPLLIHKVKKKELKNMGETKMICLIPELCYCTGLTDEMRSDFRVMKDLAQHTRLTPNARQASLRKFIRNVNDNPEAKQILSEWGLILLDDNVELEGRVLPTETIIFGSREIEGSHDADFSREACRENVIRPIDIKSGLWMVVFTMRDEAKVIKFVDVLKQVTRFMGIFVGDPKMIKLARDTTDYYVNKIRENYHDQLQLAVVIFPIAREDRYSAVKRLTCSELGLASQCINARTISVDQKLRSVTQKIALQINCKLGGELWALKIPMTALMVCGVDVYHDPVRRGNSVVGFVASLNTTLTRWYSKALFQKPGDEIIHGMRIALLESLRKYYEEHHILPKTIVIYRDGVGDGMLKIIEELEVPELTNIFLNFDSYEPKFFYIVVQKRINTRIFASLNGRGMNNPPPGSIIDHTITKRHWFDFLLVSQNVRQGTVTPSHYIVVRDAGSLKPEHIQRLTYKLTYLYYNWPGTIRVPAPCQYAHKLAYLVGQNIRKEPHMALRDKLYYL